MAGEQGGRRGDLGAISGFVVHTERGLTARAMDMARATMRYGLKVKRKFSLERVKDASVLLTLLLHLHRALPRQRADIQAATMRPFRRWLTVLAGGASIAALSAVLMLGERELDAAPLPKPAPSRHMALPAPSLAASAAPPAQIASSPVQLSDETQWVPVKRPMPIFHLEAPEVDAADLHYRVATRGPHARQDQLSWLPSAAREAATPRVQAHLVLERFEKTQPMARPLFSDMAMRAAEQKVSLERLAAPTEIITKFGRIEIADAVLNADKQNRTCLVFRRVDMIGFTLAGWYCGTPSRPADRVSFACFINRLDLVGAGQDQALKRFFGEAERNRINCPNARLSGRKLTWLDHEAPLPPLKRNYAAVR